MCASRPGGRDQSAKRCAPRAAGALAALMTLAGCVAAPAAPTIPVVPGPGKSFAAFDADQAACQQYASTQLAPTVLTYNKFSVGSVALTTALGAGIGAAAAAGSGAASGATAGAVFGTGANAIAAGRVQPSLQQQYDIFYAYCMVKHGNRLPRTARNERVTGSFDDVVG
jgi:hypothetical protein